MEPARLPEPAEARSIETASIETAALPAELALRRLVLRPLRPEDAGALTLYASDYRVARMTTSIPHPYLPDFAAAYIESVRAGRRPERVWAMDATPIGGAALVGAISIRQPGPELGYWVGPPFWGTGFASEAVVGLTAALFAAGVGSVEAAVFQDNAASAWVLSKLGFARVGRRESFSVARGAAVASDVFRLAAPPGERA